MDREKHLTRDTAAIEARLATIDLYGRHVLEIGAGDGVLTRLILARGPASVVAFEIEPGLCRVRDPRLVLREEDAEKADYDAFEWDCVIAIPPYSLLPVLLREVRRRSIEDVIVMVPKARAAHKPPLDLEGFVTVAELSGASFSPPSKGTHCVVQRGFR